MARRNYIIYFYLSLVVLFLSIFSYCFKNIEIFEHPNYIIGNDVRIYQAFAIINFVTLIVVNIGYPLITIIFLFSYHSKEILKVFFLCLTLRFIVYAVIISIFLNPRIHSVREKYYDVLNSFKTSSFDSNGVLEPDWIIHRYEDEIRMIPKSTLCGKCYILLKKRGEDFEVVDNRFVIDPSLLLRAFHMP